YDFTKTVPINCVKNSNVPICFIHGASDTFIQPHHSVDMYNVCQNPNSELHLFDGAEHARSIAVDKPRYEQVVCDFIHKIENL
ncbi:MAG: dienelactone hydrolase family protein, partial [Clostridia bacterium]|nr:dienelactone hydrolase family protein [Clostridia bacterium]